MSESVKVAVRCRPLNQKELQHKCKSVITIDSGARSCSLSDDSGAKVYQFDATFGPETSTETVYEDVGSYVVEAVLEGYNGTVFAYGQTGCGKSFTMRGFIERALEHLFDATSTASSDTRYLALLTYLEIYNEKLRDLLETSADANNENQLQLKEDPVRGTYVAGGLREVTVKDANECCRLLEQGDRRRAAAATKMNAVSSRSHAVLTISLEAIAVGPGVAESGAVRRGRLHLVDLAGSERQRRTGATGDRLKEAASINLSLSALGNVISALAAGNGRHVPYRDSKLTRLLRDSLGGNARTLMIACVSPSDVDAEETLSTLRYAARARCIKNKPIVNEDPKDALLRQYQLELQRLRKLLESASSACGEPEEPKSAGPGQVGGADVEIIVSSVEQPDLAKVEEEEEEEEEPREAKSPPEPESREVPSSEDLERLERRRKKQEAAKQEVLRRLERLTIGGEALGDDEIRRRRERRRKRLRALAEALERSSQEGNSCTFEVYGQLKSTEDALKRMAKRVKQLEAETADLQASWDEERREMLRRELLTQQMCEAMLPHLRPGCPLRDLAWVREASAWSTELGRWRLPDVSGKSYISLPPAQNSTPPPPPPPPPTDASKPQSRPDHNNNNNNNNNNSSSRSNSSSGRNSRGSSGDEDSASDSESESTMTTAAPAAAATDGSKKVNIADVYFKRNRIDKILAHVREAKTFDAGMRVSKSGSSSEELQPPLAALQSIGPSQPHRQLGSLGALSGPGGPDRLTPRIGGWLGQEQQQHRQSPAVAEAAAEKRDSPPYGTALASLKRNHLQPPPRILEALPAYPQITASGLPHRLQGPIS